MIQNRSEFFYLLHRAIQIIHVRFTRGLTGWLPRLFVCPQWHVYNVITKGIKVTRGSTIRSEWNDGGRRRRSMPQILISFFNVYANRILLSLEADLCCSRKIYHAIKHFIFFHLGFRESRSWKIVTGHLFRKIFFTITSL